MSRIVTIVHRPKRAPRPKAAQPALATPSPIVRSRRPGAQRSDVPDMTPEEHQRRGDAADALWVELVRRATSKDRPP
jgi:hypothetical protein